MREKILEILAETAGVPVSDLHDDTRLIQCIWKMPGSASLSGIFYWSAIPQDRCVFGARMLQSIPEAATAHAV